MKRDRIAVWLLMGCLLVVPTTASAYIGPGLGEGAIAAALGVIGSIFLAIFAVLYYPIKRALKKRRDGEKPVAADKAVK